MTSVFAGMGGVLSVTLGAPITYRPLSGAARAVQSIFRQEPIEVLGGDGMPVIVSQPTWRVAADLVTGWQEGDLVEPGNGHLYRLRHVMPSSSPAADALLTFPLEEAA